MGWTVRRSNPFGARFSDRPDWPWVHPASCKMDTESFQGVKSGRGVTLTPHPLLVPWSWKGRAIPLLSLRAVRPVQSLSTCTRVTFTFTVHLCHLSKLSGCKYTRGLNSPDKSSQSAAIFFLLLFATTCCILTGFIVILIA